jgi:hypothetical protein
LAESQSFEGTHAFNAVPLLIIALKPDFFVGIVIREGTKKGGGAVFVKVDRADKVRYRIKGSTRRRRRSHKASRDMTWEKDAFSA